MSKFKLKLFFVMMIFSLAAGSVFSEDPQPAPSVIYKKYPVKSGAVEYIISGAQKGIEVVYFDDWGMREVHFRRSESEMFGMVNRLILLDRDWVYTIDTDKKLGTKVQDLDVAKILNEPAESSEVNVNERLMSLWEASLISEEKIIGKACKVWRVERKGQKLWFWNWLPLKSETKTGVNEVILTAVSVNLDVPIPPEKFQIPDGIKYIQGDLDSILISAKPQKEKEDL